MNLYTFKIGKLCRDKTVSRLEGWGGYAQWKTLDHRAYADHLRLKLKEEADEVSTADTHSLIGELADVLEVVDALCAFYNIEKNDLLAMQKQKRAERGGFHDRIFVESATVPEGKFPETYYREHPDKYPLITKK